MLRAVEGARLAPPLPGRKSADRLPNRAIAVPIATVGQAARDHCDVSCRSRSPSRGRDSVAVRDRLTDLTGAMTKAPVIAALGVIPWAALAGNLDEWSPLGKGFLLTLAIAWAALLAVGDSSAKPEDSWGKRFRIAGLGLLVGALRLLARRLADARDPRPTATEIAKTELVPLRHACG